MIDSSHAAANPAAFANRSAGTFASALVMARSSPCGSPGRALCRDGTGSRVWRTITSRTVAPKKGAWPASISYNTHAKLYRSLRPSTCPAPVACSGLIYAGVPTDMPDSVSRSPPAAVIARPIPKSTTIACPSLSRMFSGLMSRWMTS